MIRRSLCRFKSGDRYDAIVVGGGVTGTITAARLAMSDIKTLLIEAGPDARDAKDFRRKFAASYAVNRLDNKSMKWTNMIPTVPQQQLEGATVELDADNKAAMAVPTSNVLGGRGITGSKSWIMGDSADWEGVIDSEEYFNALKDMETVPVAKQDAKFAHRGKFGKWTVQRTNTASPFYKPFTDATMSHIGVPLTTSFNPESGLLKPCMGRAEVVYNDNTRTTNTVLESLDQVELLRRPLTTMTGTSAHEIRFHGTSATGVETSAGSFDAGMVIVASGALGSSGLLQNSPTLQGDVKDKIGKNLFDAPQVLLQYASREPISHHVYTDKLVQLLSLGLWIGGYHNVLEGSWDELVLFLSSGVNGKEAVDLKVVVQPMMLRNDGTEGGKHGMQVVVQLLRPHSRGSFSIDGGVDPAYLSDTRDREALEKGVGIIREMMTKSLGKLVDPNPEAVVFESSGKTGGTCAAGSVVVPNSLQLMGYSNCYVCDASVLKQPLLGDPLPTMAGLGSVFANALIGGRKTTRLSSADAKPKKVA